MGQKWDRTPSRIAKHRAPLTERQRITRHGLTRLAITAPTLAALAGFAAAAPAGLVGLAWIAVIWLVPVAVTRGLSRAFSR